VRATFRPVLRLARATLRPVLRVVRATFRPVLRAVRAVLRAVVFLIAIVFLTFCFDSVTLHFSQTLRSAMASQLIFEGEVKMLRCRAKDAATLKIERLRSAFSTLRESYHRGERRLVVRWLCGDRNRLIEVVPHLRGDKTNALPIEDIRPALRQILRKARAARVQPAQHSD